MNTSCQAGRLFHTTGPATEKALSSNFVLVHGTVSVVKCCEWVLFSESVTAIIAFV